MQELVKLNEVGMTSLQVAELTGKRHDNVIRDIKSEINVLGREIAELIFEESAYLDKNNQSRPCYNLTEEGVMQLALKYDAVSRYKCIQELKRLKELKQKPMLPTTYLEALEQLIEKEKMLIEQKPKVDYYDEVLDTSDTMPITVIAKEFRMSAFKMNELLVREGVQYWVNGQYVLKSKYQDKGYTKTTTVTYKNSKKETCVKHSLYWTEKGRRFLYDFINKL